MKQELFGSLFLVVLFSVTVFGQDQDKYIIGSEKKLEMIVHIMGEVRKPGEYRVEDNTNLVELISKAGAVDPLSNQFNIPTTPATARTKMAAPNTMPLERGRMSRHRIIMQAMTPMTRVT